jgi:hypothetical protein
VALGLDLDLRTARLQLLADAIDAATTPGRCVLYPGTRPAVAGGSTSEDPQCEITLADPCGVVAQVGDLAVLTFEPEVEGIRIDDQVITWARFNDGDGNFVLDASVTSAGGGGDIIATATGGLVGSFVRIVDPSTISE